jgi:hypothetical protein
MPPALGGLGRKEPTDWEHVEKYPLTALRASEVPTRAPVVIGVNWYSNFDSPVKDSSGNYWIGRSSNLGAIRGGHAVCLLPTGVIDPDAWWEWFNQIREGICVSEGVARCMGLLNRKRYQPRPLYDHAQLIDEWEGENYDGTSVRAGLEVARTAGLVPARSGEPHYVLKGQVTRPPVQSEGISAYRWMQSMDEVIQVLGLGSRQYVTILNSWGKAYPRKVRLPLSVLARLHSENGEIGMVTDR